MTLRIGLISDTHNLLRPEALAFLRGCDRIVHAGDIMGPGILEELSTIAPVTVVRGNNDRGEWASGIRETEIVRCADVSVYVVHDIADLNIEPAGAGVQVVVSGHSHKPSLTQKGGVMFINPGSAGPRRFKLPISVGELLIGETQISARTIELGVPPGAEPLHRADMAKAALRPFSQSMSTPFSKNG